MTPVSGASLSTGVGTGVGLGPGELEVMGLGDDRCANANQVAPLTMMSRLMTPIVILLRRVWTQASLLCVGRANCSCGWLFVAALGLSASIWT